MRSDAIENARSIVLTELGNEPVRCRYCATWVSRRGIPSHVAVLACEALACQQQAQAYLRREGWSPPGPHKPGLSGSIPGPATASGRAA